MKIHIANFDSTKTGGGWSFTHNFIKAMGDVITDYNNADVYFIPSASMVSRDDVWKAKQDGKRIVLRCDNIIRNSRNRNTGMSRMKDFAEWADVVIYQSESAKKLLQPFLKRKGVVILNSTDESVFKASDAKRIPDSYLYSRQNRDETKNFEVARHTFSEIYQKNPESMITFVGSYSQELVDGNFDFYMGENYRYYGSLTDREALASLYQSHEFLMYTYWHDACSNTIIEALMCDMFIHFPSDFFYEGSASEIMQAWDLWGRDYFSLPRMAKEYRIAIESMVRS